MIYGHPPQSILSLNNFPPLFDLGVSSLTLRCIVWYSIEALKCECIQKLI